MNQSQLDEGPETPAHVFAFRAFKTALFGTPAAPPQRCERVIDDKDVEEELEEVNVDDAGLFPPKSQPNIGASPTKSILVTPGAAADPSRRKTVSFSGLRRELKPEDISSLADVSVEAILDQPESNPRRSLFRSRSEPMITLNEDDNAPRQSYDTEDSSRAIDGMREQDCGDETIDLGAPRSHSGKHWKQEYQKEHDKSKAEMQKLIRYSQIAKSYAIKRDDEAVRMREKLVEAESKMQEMERQVAQLATELGAARADGTSQANLLDELAKQTAQALRYKQKAEKYQAALEEDERLRPNKHMVDNLNETRRQDASLASALSAENQILSSELATLKEDNVRLKRTLARFEEEKKKYEERHRIWLQERRRKDERANAKRKALQDQVLKLKSENNRLSSELELNKDSQPYPRTRSVSARPSQTFQPQAPSQPRVGASDQPADRTRGAVARHSGSRHKDREISTSKKPEPNLRVEAEKIATVRRLDDIERLRQELHEKLVGEASRPAEESLDLCNLPRSRTTARQATKGDNIRSAEEKVRTNDRHSRTVEGTATSKHKKSMPSPGSGSGPPQTDYVLEQFSDRVDAARADLAALLAKKHLSDMVDGDGKENVKPVTAL